MPCSALYAALTSESCGKSGRAQPVPHQPTSTALGDRGDTERKALSALLVSQLESSDTATRLQKDRPFSSA